MPDITLPVAAAPRARWTSPDPEFITLEQAETSVQATGQHRGTEVTFSNDGETWVTAWVPGKDDDDHLILHPMFARALVKRKLVDGDVVETLVTIRWDEYVPDQDDPRRPEWEKRPTIYLGKCAKVSAYRGGYRDVIGNRYEPAELHQAGDVA